MSHLLRIAMRSALPSPPLLYPSPPFPLRCHKTVYHQQRSPGWSSPARVMTMAAGVWFESEELKCGRRPLPGLFRKGDYQGECCSLEQGSQDSGSSSRSNQRSGQQIWRRAGSGVHRHALGCGDGVVRTLAAKGWSEGRPAAELGVARPRLARSTRASGPLWP